MVRQPTRNGQLSPVFARVNAASVILGAGMGGALNATDVEAPISQVFRRGQLRIVNRQVEVSVPRFEPAVPHESWRIDGFQVTVLRGPSATRERFERELREAGWGLPMQHRSSWVSLQPQPNDHWLLCVRDATGRPCGAVGVRMSVSRALPGHRLLRAERFGPGISPKAHAAALQVLVALARRDQRVLRLYVESLAYEPDMRVALESTIESAGFVGVPSPRCYERTLVLPLDGDEESILASFHRTARQNIRSIVKYPVRVAQIVDPGHFARVNEISEETFARTGGRFLHVYDWAAIAALGAREPDASRLVGLYRTDQEGPAGLLAFAWACGHGDHAHYSAAGSTRPSEGRIPLLYPVIWDLILWAKRSGMRFFDFGGVTGGTLGSEDPLGGISDFKRYFTKTVAQVGAEWAYEPRPSRVKAAQMVKSASSLLSRMLSRA